MKSKAWLVSFFITVAAVFVLSAVLNVLVDPFGLFGDPIFDWYEYNFTNNHRLAKTAYLDRHFREYDSYIIGSSVAGSIPTELLDGYMGAKFFNYFGNGGDMRRSLQITQYILEHYNARNIVLVMSITDGAYHNLASNKLTHYMPAWVDGSPPLARGAQYAEYLFADPRYAINKIDSSGRVTYLPQAFDTCIAKTGGLNREANDSEPIGDLQEYRNARSWTRTDDAEKRTLWHIDKCAADLAEIVSLCELNSVNLLVIFPAYYDLYLKASPVNQRSAFLKAIADVTDYWDFSHTSVSMEPRYFYDPGHLRTPVAEMMLARIFGDESVYVPPDFGFLVTSENADAHVARLAEPPPSFPIDGKLPVLLWESHGAGGQAAMASFEAQIAAIKDAGYHSVTFGQAADFVLKGLSLPEKPIVLVLGELEPDTAGGMRDVLDRYGFSASSIASGDSLGAQSGYHSEADFIEAFRRDFDRISQKQTAAAGDPFIAYAYRQGEASRLTDALLTEMGVPVTLVKSQGEDGGASNTIVRGLPQSLLQLKMEAVDVMLSPSEVSRILGG